MEIRDRFKKWAETVKTNALHAQMVARGWKFTDISFPFFNPDMGMGDCWFRQTSNRGGNLPPVLLALITQKNAAVLC